YSTYASSLEELSAHLKETWSDAILEDSTWQKAEQLGVAKTGSLPAARCWGRSKVPTGGRTG
ncbi:MAG: hypothetical protein ACMUIA_08065, partial [bacterium]